MLSADEHPGVFTFMVGLIVLVMAGVGLSLLVDRRFQFSSGVVELRREAKLAESEIAELKVQNEERSLLLTGSGAKRQTDSKSHKQICDHGEAMRRRKAELLTTRDELLASVASIEEQFSRCRTEYRRRTWLGAVGEDLGTLALRGGREYRQVTIRRVTDVGLEIHHQDGIARVQGPDLDPKLQDRFQWNDEERRLRLKEEHLHLEGEDDKAVAGNETKVVTTGAPTARELRKIKRAEETEKRNGLRQQVRNWKVKVGKLNSEHSEAESRSGYGSKSVPGSLETWQARALRLGKELARARAALELAKADLAAVAPSDPLLAPEE